MTRRALLSLLLAGIGGWIGSACRPAPDSRGPREAIERYAAATRANDWPALYEIASARARAGRSREEFLASGAANPGFARAMNARSQLEVISAEVEGERASVLARVEIPDLRALPPRSGPRLPTEEEIASAPLHSFERRFEIVHEDGAWRVDVAPPGLPDPAVMERLERVKAAAAPAGGTTGSAGSGP